MEQFLVVLRIFSRIWGSPIAQKSEVRFICLTISPKLLHQIGQTLSHFVDPKPALFAVFSGFSRRLNQKFGGKNFFFITLNKELNVLNFFKILNEFLTKMSDYWLDLLILGSSLKRLVTVLTIFFTTVIQWWMWKNESLLKFYGWVVSCVNEQVFRRAFCVF